MPSISGKTLGTDGNSVLQLSILFDAGSDFNAFTDSLGQQSGTFDIAQVQIEPGPVATPFEQRPIGTELNLCHRYARWVPFTMFGYTAAGGAVTNQILFSTEMRVAPTAGANVQDPELGTATTANVASAGINNLTRNGCTLFMTLTATGGGEVSFYRSLLTAEL